MSCTSGYLTLYSTVVCIQILKFVNPNVSYKPKEQPGKKCPGVAIVLKELLALLDQLSIEHLDESIIRRNLRSRKDVETSATQRFIRKGGKKMLSCIIVPRSEVPQSFFDRITEGRLN